MALQSDKLRLLRRIPKIRFEEELRGYSKQQVDRVLENLAPLADEIESLQNRLAEAETRAAGAEARLLESSGRESDIAAPGDSPCSRSDSICRRSGPAWPPMASALCSPVTCSWARPRIV